MSRPARRDPSKLVDGKGFREFVRHRWGPSDRAVRLADGAADTAARHREQLRDALPGTRIAVASGWAPVRSNDTDYGFRPDSDFSWLTGCSAEGAVLVLHSDGDAELFLREPAEPGEADFFADAREAELWIGPVPGTAEWAAATGLPCRPIHDQPRALGGKLPTVYATRGVDLLLDALAGPDHSAELRRVLAELRRVKDGWEVGQLEDAGDAVDAVVQGFADVAAELKTAVASGGERWLQGTFDRRARTEGNGPGYASIVAAGPHAPILHWVRNNGPVPEDAVLVLDAGVALDTLYTADITRTLPVSGQYSAAQRQVHDLGLDMHDCANASPAAYHDGSLEEGMTLAVEPGRYFHPHDETVPRELRGIGVRIEENVVVTAFGNQVLSSALPRDAPGLEEWVMARC